MNECPICLEEGNNYRQCFICHRIVCLNCIIEYTCSDCFRDEDLKKHGVI